MQDNDIVLCDGDCGRAYHEQCLQPRIHVNELPEEEGWLCHACDAKVETAVTLHRITAELQPTCMSQNR